MRSRINVDALRNLAASVNLTLLAKELGISRPTLYLCLADAPCKRRNVADKVNANITRLRKRFQLTELIANGLNNRANYRISVRSSARGPFTRHEILRYPLGPIHQRYDATTQTLTVHHLHLHDIIRKSSHITDRYQARADLINRQLIVRSPVQVNLAYGASLPHRLLDCYTIDLQRIEWATLATTCKLSAERHDPVESGIVYNWSTRYQVDHHNIAVDGHPSTSLPHD